MSTTLNLLLGDKPPHLLRPACITREHMLNLHDALLKWLLTGTPPPLREPGYLLDNIGITLPEDSMLHLNHSIGAASRTLPPGLLWHPHRAPSPPPQTACTTQYEPRKRACTGTTDPLPSATPATLPPPAAPPPTPEPHTGQPQAPPPKVEPPTPASPRDHGPIRTSTQISPHYGPQ